MSMPHKLQHLHHQRLLVAPHPVVQQHHLPLLLPHTAADTAVVGKQDTVQLQRHHMAPQHTEQLQLGRMDLSKAQQSRPQQSMGKPAAGKALLAAYLG